MVEQGALFDLTPEEKHGEIEKTHIEYFQLAFSDGEKKEILSDLEYLLKYYNYDNYSDYIIMLIRNEYEKIKSEL